MADTSQLLKTPLYEQHKALDARIVDFGGWALPVNYSSQVEEHHAVRKNVGMFDVSHMTVSDITGSDTVDFLSTLLANDIAKITSIKGKALYSCMLNEKGGVIDDLIVYYLSDSHCRLVTNAGTNAKDMAWLQKHAQNFEHVSVTEKPDLALIAVQGPNAIDVLKDTLGNELSSLLDELKRFQGGFESDNEDDNSVFVGRTGYTGEDGVVLIIPSERVVEVWTQLLKAGIQPCGLGARDTLRLEAGMALYGADLDEQHSPLDSGLSWTVAMKDEREFIGRSALQTPAKYQMVGLMLQDKGVLRGHQTVMLNDEVIGEVTSGTFSPTLERSIALARISNDSAISIGSELNVQVRNKLLNVSVVKYPFI